MKKNLLFILLLILFLTNTIQVQAKNIIAETIEDFDSTNPPRECSFKITEDTVIDKHTMFEKDCVIRGKIEKVIPPKRLKKDAYFIFRSQSFTIPSQDNKVIKIRDSYKAKTKVKPYTRLDKVAVAGKIASTAAGTMVKGLGVGISFIEGAVEAKEGENRFGAGAKNIYEDSPLSYGKKGADLCLKAGSLVKFSIDKDLFDEIEENN